MYNELGSILLQASVAKVGMDWILDLLMQLGTTITAPPLISTPYSSL
jgi:hypothetical protein